ncbi:hypothetical protein GGI21_004914, partial [Coemansia aciculifera]
TWHYYPTITDFVNEHAKIVEIERDVNIDDMVKLLSTKSTKELARLGLALVDLHITKQRIADQNATLVTLKTNSAFNVLPNTVLRTGDIVKIDDAGNDDIIAPFDMDKTIITS